MSTPREEWFVEQFYLRSPLEEFQDFGRGEIERHRDGDARFDDATHRAAIDLVLRKLRAERTGERR